MAEGFEPYHVPQQSRRDKLRVVNHLQPPPPPACVNSLYDPSSLLSSDLITNLHRHSLTYNLMGFAGGIYADPHLSSLNLNPASDVNSTPDAYPYHPFHGNEPPHTAAAGQSLSLSLSSHQSNLNLPLELNLQRYENSPVFSSDKVNEGYLVSCHEGGGGGGGGAVELSKSTVPLGPFTGYASVLRGSRFLKPAQQLLEELCDAGKGIYADKNGLDSSLLETPPLETLIVDGGDQTRKKSRLLSMLDEIYKRYKQYCQQMQAAVAAFESVAGFSNAAPFANLALKSMSKHFKCLKNAITQQLQFPSRPRDRDETRLENPGGSSTSYSQRPFHVDQPVWRPQRGLPERAVIVLRAWLFEHFLHPYPTDTDKIMLAKQTGLSRNQVSNWFINARVRLWKPMVEEIHTLETRQGQAEERPPPSSVNDQLPTSCSIECENASTSVHRMGDFTLKRSREDPIEGSAGAMVQIKMPYESLLHNHNHPGVELSNAGGGNGGVSLTLGLHQNGVGLPDSYPMNAARRFGLDSPGDGGYVVSGVAAQNRQFGRGIIDGQIMHDFVG